MIRARCVVVSERDGIARLCGSDHRYCSSFNLFLGNILIGKDIVLGDLPGADTTVPA